MKVGPRNAMVIAVCSLALSVDRERGELRAAYGSAGPVPALVTAPLEEAASFAGARRRGGLADRRRPRVGRRTGGTRCGCWPQRALERCTA